MGLGHPQDSWFAFVEDYASNFAEILENSTTSELADMAAQVSSLWVEGFLEGGPGSQEQRDAFFEYMETFGVDIEHFDWDDWRDWYNAD